jgi:type III pantothenate kinase
MSTIAVDAGNSSLKLAWVEDGRVGPVERIPTDPAPDPLLIAERLAELAFDGPPDAGVTLVSVVPAVTALVREAASVIGARLLVADATTIPLATHVDEPGRVGADRLLAAWGAGRRHGTPVVVVDMGTATTVDALDADGTFLGGAIAPGMELGLRALARGTAQLPPIEPALPRRAIGRDTVSAIRSGVVLGHLGVIRELVARIVAELPHGGDRPRVVATGGMTAAPWMRDLLLHASGPALPPIVDAVDPDLVLRSLGQLADRLHPVRS